MCCLLRVVVSLGLCLLSRQSLEAADWPQWRGPDRDGHSGVSVVGGKIFTSGNQKDGQAIVAISAADGKQLWSTTITSSVPRHGSQGARTTPAVDGKRLYVVTSNGGITCLDTTNGKVLWQKDFVKAMSCKTSTAAWCWSTDTFTAATETAAEYRSVLS